MPVFPKYSRWLTATSATNITPECRSNSGRRPAGIGLTFSSGTTVHSHDDHHAFRLSEHNAGLAYTGCLCPRRCRFSLSSVCGYTSDATPSDRRSIPVQASIFGVKRNQVRPLVMLQMLQDFMPTDEFLEVHARRFDNGQ